MGKSKENKRVYEIIFVDEYDNFYRLGVYRNLKDCYSDLNHHVSDYIGLDEDGNEIGYLKFGKNIELEEYAGTFSPVIDKIIDVPEGSIQVRGFVMTEKDYMEITPHKEKCRVKKNEI